MAEARAMGSICANCLSRLRIASPAPTTRIPITRFFHSTPSNLNVVKKKTPGQQAGVRSYAHRESRSATFKKKGRERPSLPAVGERKALRKRIVLSNTNAIAVDGLQDLSQENMADEQLQSQIMGLPATLTTQLRAAEAFKPTQNWSMFRSPSTLMRKETIELAKILKDMAKEESRTKAYRAILDGPKLGGKSLVLLQAMSMAFLNGWVVLNIPEGQDFVIAHSSYRPLAPGSDGEQSYTQPDLTAALLRRMAQSNKEVLSKLTLNHTHPDFPEPLQSNLSLYRLADRGATNPALAPEVFSALWKELTVPGPENSQARPPLLVAIDGLNHLMTQSAYRAADFTHIHAHQFTMIRHFLSLLFGKKDVQFGPAGGVVLGATSGSNTPGNYTLDVSLEQLAARTSSPPVAPDSPDFPLPEPYHKLDQRVLDMFNGGDLQLQNINGLSKAEARGFLEYFAKSGLLREKITDELVAEKWSLSAGGIVGFVEQAAGRVRA